MAQHNTRNQKIQFLRGIAICAVVIIHTDVKGIYGVILRTFINFAVSLFFFLSGYLTNLEKTINWKIVAIKRLKRVVIPYIIWSALATIVTHNFDGFIFRLLIGDCVYPYYFVFVYVQFVAFTPLIMRLIKSRYRWVGWLFQPVAIILLRYLGFERFIPFSNLFLWFGPYYLGLLFGNHISQCNIEYKKAVCLWGASFFISLAEGLVWYNAGYWDLATTQLKLTNCIYTSAFLMLAYKFINDKEFEINGILARIMIPLGDYSFGIFLIHAFVLSIMRHHLPIYQRLFFPINSILAIIFTSLCIWIGRKTFGEKHGKYLGFF